MKYMLLSAIICTALQIGTAQDVQEIEAATESRLPSLIPTLTTSWVPSPRNRPLKAEYTSGNKQFSFMASKLKPAEFKDGLSYLAQIEKSLLYALSNSVPMEGRGDMKLLDLDPDWITIEYENRPAQSFRLSSIHRSLPFMFAMESDESERTHIIAHLEQQLSEFPHTGTKPLRPTIDTLPLDEGSPSPMIIIFQPMDSGSISEPAMAFIAHLRTMRTNPDQAEWISNLSRIEIRPWMGTDDKDRDAIFITDDPNMVTIEVVTWGPSNSENGRPLRVLYERVNEKWREKYRR